MLDHFLKDLPKIMIATKAIMKSAAKIKKMILAIPAAATEIPVKPKMPAIKDMTKKMMAQVNIV